VLCILFSCCRAFFPAVAHHDMQSPALFKPSIKVNKNKNHEGKIEFNSAWTHYNAGWPGCLMCCEKLSNSRTCNVERLFQNEHTAFVDKYQAAEVEPFLTCCSKVSKLIYFHKVSKLNNCCWFCGGSWDSEESVGESVSVLGSVSELLRVRCSSLKLSEDALSQRS